MGLTINQGWTIFEVVPSQIKGELHLKETDTPTHGTKEDAAEAINELAMKQDKKKHLFTYLPIFETIKEEEE